MAINSMRCPVCSPVAGQAPPANLLLLLVFCLPFGPFFLRLARPCILPSFRAFLFCVLRGLVFSTNRHTSHQTPAFLSMDQDLAAAVAAAAIALAVPQPSALSCAVTFETCEDPVVLPGGTTYDRATITKWKNIDPITHRKLKPTEIVDNRAVRDCIDELESLSEDANVHRAVLLVACNSTSRTDWATVGFQSLVDLVLVLVSPCDALCKVEIAAVSRDKLLEGTCKVLGAIISEERVDDDLAKQVFSSDGIQAVFRLMECCEGKSSKVVACAAAAMKTMMDQLIGGTQSQLVVALAAIEEVAKADSNAWRRFEETNTI